MDSVGAEAPPTTAQASAPR
ncbi:DUF6053 domain-containing protein [Lysobacter enzymogenes]